MARISDQELNRLKEEVSLLRLIESQGYQPKKQGKDYAICCPFHEDDTASLIITPDKNLFHCFGCSAAGTVIDWIMKTQGVSFRHAVELLQSDSPAFTQSTRPARGAGSAADTKPVKRSRSAKLDTPFALNVDDQKLLNDIIDYYHDSLKQHPEALAYLDKRGISADAMNHFKLGYANRSLGYRLPPKTVKDGQSIRTQLQTIGLLRESGHEHFNGSLVIPVINLDGHVKEVYGRKIGERLRKGTPKHLYLPGSHQGVFNLAAFEGNPGRSQHPASHDTGTSLCGEIILCESLIDALTFWTAGYRNVTASYGTEGFTDDILQALIDHKIERVLIAYDRDEAGKKAASALAAKLMKQGIDCYRIQFPKGMDANDYALQVQPASESLGLVIRKAVWLGSGEAPKRETTPVLETKEEPVTTEPTETLTPTEAKALPAHVIPPTPKDIEAEVSDQEINITLGGRRYRIRGLSKNLSVNQLKVNVLVAKGDALHVDSFDLYGAKSRSLFIKQASLELGVEADVIKADLGKVLLKLEQLQEQNINQTLPAESVKPLDEIEKQQALELLRSPDLIQRILDDFNRCGVVGEETNKLMGYLACVSRKLDKPLAIIIQSTSAAGKSSLMDAILNLMPTEERVQYSAMTGQSLFYMGETNLKHKILGIAEEEGASNASYALKLLQSEGELTIASTGKDEASGEMMTKEYRVEGPVMLFLTTTAIDIDEELMNRCIVLTVNESRAQTQAIHAMQRRQQTLEGLLLNEDKKQLTELHRNAQQLIKPLLVANPYAEQLTFIDDKTRTRRDHLKYLTLINSIALLHQYQRDIKTVTHDGRVLEYIEVIPADIKIANRLAHEVLGRSLDELPPQTRKLLKQIHTLVTEQCQTQGMAQSDYRFSRKQIRDYTGDGNTQLKLHLNRLEEMEYLLIHRGGRGQSIVYELLYDGDLNDQNHLMGLIDPENLTHDEKKSGVNTNQSGSSRVQVGPKSGGSRGSKNNRKTNNSKALRETEAENTENEYVAPKTNGTSYRSHTTDLAAG